jgi:hypothetical protein
MRTRHIFFIVAVLSLTISPTSLTSNAAPNSIEINSISEVSCTSVEILFESSVPKKSLVNYVITAAVDPSVGQPKNIKKIIKTKATGLITAEIKNLNPKVSYKFSVSAKTNKGKMINSEAVEYYSLCDLTDKLSNLPADWGNPKPIQIPVAAPVAAPAFTLSSSTETRTVNTAATGFTINSTGGAIASFAINATPPGMSFNTTTSALTGTPNTVAAATNYTINATNASGSATQTFTLTVSIAAPAFTLSSATETKTAGSTITGYTISSTGGAIASYTISPAAPAGLTFSTSTGLLSGTPTTVAAATAYTITATNASGSTTQTFTLTVTAVIYTVGQTGPGGGIVYYVSASDFTSTGSACNTTCKYLEAAPSGWNSGADPQKPWATGTADSGNAILDVGGITNDNPEYNNALGVGLGYANSLAIVTQNGAGTTYAAGAARAYTGGSKTDWYLPTTAELNLLCQWNRGVAINVATVCTGGNLNSGTYGAGSAGFVEDFYWSSSERNNDNAWLQFFGNGVQSVNFKGDATRYVRPVRAF